MASPTQLKDFMSQFPYRSRHYIPLTLRSDSEFTKTLGPGTRTSFQLISQPLGPHTPSETFHTNFRLDLSVVIPANHPFSYLTPQQFLSHLLSNLEDGSRPQSKEKFQSTQSQSNPPSSVPTIIKKPNEITWPKLPVNAPQPDSNLGWMRAIDEELVLCNIGVANLTDSYEEAKRKLNLLATFHQELGAYFNTRADPT